MKEKEKKKERNDKAGNRENSQNQPETKATTRIIGIFGIILIIIGLIIFFYPIIANLLSELNHSQAIRNYSNTIEETSEEEIAEAYEEATTYNENLSGDPVHDPFLKGSGYAIPDNYEEVLDLSR